MLFVGVVPAGLAGRESCKCCCCSLFLDARLGRGVLLFAHLVPPDLVSCFGFLVSCYRFDYTHLVKSFNPPGQLFFWWVVWLFILHNLCKIVTLIYAGGAR